MCRHIHNKTPWVSFYVNDSSWQLIVIWMECHKIASTQFPFSKSPSFCSLTSESKMVRWVSTWTIYWVKEKLSSLISHTWESSFKLFQDTNDIFLLKSFTLPLIQIRVLWSKLMTQCKPPQAVFPSSKASLFISMQWEDASIWWMCLSQPIKWTCKFFNSWGENYISVSPNVHVCLVGALSTPDSLKAPYFLHVKRVYVCTRVGGK